MIPHALTIAGSDSGGGAGIQADLKTFSALGAYGMSVITALTAQNTRGVNAVAAVEPAFVAAQLDAVFEDIRVDAVKCGMLANAGIIRAVAAGFARWKPAHVVLDTVMIAKGGHPLLEPEAVTALRDELLPRASLITPNLPEAAALLGLPVASTEDAMLDQADRLLALGAPAVLMKGGHLTDTTDSPDWLVMPGLRQRFVAPRVATRHTHGTGCTLASACAAGLAWGKPVQVAAAEAWAYVAEAIRRAPGLGGGHGPLDHAWPVRGK